MNKELKIATAAGLIVYSLLVGLIFFDSSKEKTKPSNQQVENPVAINQLCDCYALAGQSYPDTLLRLTNGERVRHPLLFVNATSPTQQVVSPQQTTIAAIVGNGEKVQIAKIFDSLAQTVYTAPLGYLITSIVWSPDEKYLVISLQSKDRQANHEGILPERMDLVTVASNATVVVLNRTDVQLLGGSLLYPLAVNEGASKIIFGIDEFLEKGIWMWQTSGVKKIPTPLTFSTFSTITSAENTTQITWVGQGNLQSLNIETELNKTLAERLWSDSPVSRPSPDGRYLMYAQADAQGAGYLWKIDLVTGETQQIVTSVLPDRTQLFDGFWSPDNKYFFYQEDYLEPDTYVVVNTEEHGQKSRQITMPEDLSGKRIIALFPATQ